MRNAGTNTIRNAGAGSLLDTTLKPETENEENLLLRLKQTPILYDNFRQLNEEWRRRFLDFCQGKKSLPLTYDPFFKRLFHPDIHPDRLSRFISCFLGISVKVVRILPCEDSVLDGGTLLIMDLLAELDDGSLVNVEIQKQGYAFPAERISCYSADLVMRQYARVKGIKGNKFTYRDIKKVYVIVMFEKSMEIFHEFPRYCIHYGKTVFDTGLPMALLQEYCLIALDVFRKFPYTNHKDVDEQNGETKQKYRNEQDDRDKRECGNSQDDPYKRKCGNDQDDPYKREYGNGQDDLYKQKYGNSQNDLYRQERINEQTAWLSLLTTENLEDATQLICQYPWLEEIYREIATLRQNPEEVLGMYSEALQILDRNTIKYMIEELQKEVEEKDALLYEKDSLLSEKDSLLSEKETLLNKLTDEINSLKKQMKNISD